MDNQELRESQLPLTKLTDSLEELFRDVGISRTVVTRAGINDRLIEYNELPVTRWMQIVNQAVRQKKLRSLVQAAVALAHAPDLYDLLNKYEQLAGQPESPQFAAPSTSSAANAQPSSADAVQTPEPPPTAPSAVSTPEPPPTAPSAVSTPEPPPTAPSAVGTRPVGQWGYAALAAIGFVASVALLLYLARNARTLLKDGAMNHVYYLVLVLAGLASAAFLFGAIQSYAEFKGKILSGTLTLGGPAVVAALVVAGGMFFGGDGSTFNITARVRDEKGMLITNGSLTLFLDSDTRTKPINADGEAEFKQIPSKFRTRAVQIQARVDGFVQVDPTYVHPLNGPVLEIRLKRLAEMSISAIPDGTPDWEERTLNAIGSLGPFFTDEQRAHLQSEYAKGEQELIALLTPDEEPEIPDFVVRVRGMLRVLLHIQKKIGPHKGWKELTDLAERRIPGITKEIQ